VIGSGGSGDGDAVGSSRDDDQLSREEACAGSARGVVSESIGLDRAIGVVDPCSRTLPVPVTMGIEFAAPLVRDARPTRAEA